jgi:hypothetical protein
MKTLTELNSKWWHRLIKVCFILLFLFCLITPVVIVVSSYNPTINESESSAVCDDGRQLQFGAKQGYENGELITRYYVFSRDYSEIAVFCASDRAIATKARSLYGPTTLDDQELARLVRSRLDVYGEDLYFPSDNYTINYVYTKRDWIGTIGYSLLSVVVTLLIFELVRRIFYYVVLGSLRPKK